MTTEELLKKIRKIEIKTKGLTKHIFSGEYHSSFKGRGMAFSEVREYHIGDEVRTIDWNVTARFNSPFVKIFQEERELTVMLIVDLSGSSIYGTQEKSKKDLAIEIAAVLAFSADSNNDKVGALFVTDKVEKYIAPAKGRKHMLYILRELIEFEPKNTATNLDEGLKFFSSVVKKRSICFVLSDYICDNSFLDSFKTVRKKHDLIALKLSDPSEYDLPSLGMIQLFNAETGAKTWVNSSSHKVKSTLKKSFQTREQFLEKEWKKMGVNYQLFGTHQDYIPLLIQLFKNRA